jgi:hypothetical protein
VTRMSHASLPGIPVPSPRWMAGSLFNAIFIKPLP